MDFGREENQDHAQHGRKTKYAQGGLGKQTHAWPQGVPYHCSTARVALCCVMRCELEHFTFHAVHPVLGIIVHRSQSPKEHSALCSQA